ncbi:hypothetical protein Tco_1161286 [Tanacetum coccineum]
MEALKFADSHNMVAYLDKSMENADFDEIVDFLNANPIRYALTVSPTIYVSYIELFWSTARTKTVNNETQIRAKVDGKTIVIIESSVRRDLHFNDEDGIACLTNTEIFENLQLMGYENLSMVAYFDKSTENVDFDEIVDFLNANPIRYALTISPTIYVSYIEQFWSTVKTKTVNNETQMRAKVDGKTIVITKSSMRRDIHFNDEDGIACLTNTEIFENLQLMGYENLSDKLIFYKSYFSP